jgi:hypothetical protein
MAKLVLLDDFNHAGDLTFYNVDDSVQRHISSKFETFVRVARDVGDGFVTSMRELYDESVSDRALNVGDLMRQKIGHIFDMDMIRKLNTIPTIRSAPNTMRRWIMAEPTIRDRFRAGAVSGYDKDFENLYPDEKGGVSHYDYRRVINGVTQIDDDGKGFTEWFHEVVPEEDVLSITQKAIILNSWDVIKNSIKSGNTEDPTSMWGGTL